MQVRQIASHDVDEILRLNRVEVPRLGPIADADEFAELLAYSDLALVADDPADDRGRILGFVLAIAPGTGYTSANYRYFEQRGTDHLYVDRIAVAPHARRRGIASALYDAVLDRARRSGRAEVTCEVNIRPRNEGSLSFHASRGFVEVGQQDTSSTVTVALLAKAITPHVRRDRV